MRIEIFNGGTFGEPIFFSVPFNLLWCRAWTFERCVRNHRVCSDSEPHAEDAHSSPHREYPKSSALSFSSSESESDSKANTEPSSRFKPWARRQSDTDSD